MTRRPLGALTAVALLALASLGLATPAASHGHRVPSFSCGAVLTSDVRLDRDLTCQADGGVVVRGDVTIDLGGHRFTGPGSEIGGTGIFVEAAGHTLVIRNGTVSGWEIGIQGSHEDADRPHVIVRNLTVSGNGSGVIDFSSFDVDRSRFERNGRGMQVFQGEATVKRSRFTDNESAIHAGTPAWLSVARSRFERNGTGVHCSDALCEITRTSFRENGTGVSGWYARGDISENTFVGNDRGAYVEWYSTSVIKNNSFRDNTTAGVEARVADTSTVRDNVFRRNGTGFLVRDEDGTPDSHTTVVDNRFTHNGNGIYIGQRTARVGGNVATKNTGWGIYAVEAEDLGGNVARQNGNEPQCVGVTCSPR